MSLLISALALAVAGGGSSSSSSTSSTDSAAEPARIGRGNRLRPSFPEGTGEIRAVCGSHAAKKMRSATNC